MRIASRCHGMLIAAVLLSGATNQPVSAEESESLGADDRRTLLRYAQDTWKSMKAMGDDRLLPVDSLRRLEGGGWELSLLTKPPDIACYLWSVLAAESLKIIATDDADRRLDRTLRAIEEVERSHGFFVDTIDPQTGRAFKKIGPDGRTMREHSLVSAVDNGWLAASLMMVRNSRPKFRDRADALLKPMDFRFFYEPYDATDTPNHPGQIRGAYRIEDERFSGFNRIINTEQRIASYVGIACGHIPQEHYYRVGRTLKANEGKQSQIPEGERRTFLSIPVFEGHYTYRGMRIVPSWGGSMFEALMVTLLVPEERWAPRSWGINHPLYVRGQIEHGLKEARYGYWGFSPATNPEGDYRTYGVDAMASDPVGYTSNNDGIRARPTETAHLRKFTNGVVTPHATFLALRYAPREALENLRKLEADFPIYGEYGFMDSVNVSKGVVSDRVLALDQGMIMAAIANALADDAMRHAFSDGLVEETLRPLMAPEEFTAGGAPRVGDGGTD